VFQDASKHSKEGFAELAVSDGSRAEIFYSHKTSEHFLEMDLNCQPAQGDAKDVLNIKLFSRVYRIRQFQVPYNVLNVKLLL
jgi:hypothetical protein